MNTCSYYTLKKANNKIKKMNKLSLVWGQFLIILFLFTIFNFQNDIYAQIENIGNENNSIQVIKDPDKEVPLLVITFGEKEVEMEPFMFSKINFTDKIKGSQLNESQDNIVTRINPAKLYETRSDIDTQLTLKQGDKITLSYEKQPLTIKAYLIDYDTQDDTEIYPIKQIDISTFSIPNNSPDGLKSLEIRTFFDNSEQITYTIPVFVESSNPVITAENVEDDNQESNNDNENPED